MSILKNIKTKEIKLLDDNKKKSILYNMEKDIANSDLNKAMQDKHSEHKFNVIDDLGKQSLFGNDFGLEERADEIQIDFEEKEKELIVKTTDLLIDDPVHDVYNEIKVERPVGLKRLLQKSRIDRESKEILHEADTKGKELRVEKIVEEKDGTYRKATSEEITHDEMVEKKKAMLEFKKNSAIPFIDDNPNMVGYMTPDYDQIIEDQRNAKVEEFTMNDAVIKNNFEEDSINERKERDEKYNFILETNRLEEELINDLSEKTTDPKVIKREIHKFLVERDRELAKKEIIESKEIKKIEKEEEKLKQIDLKETIKTEKEYEKTHKKSKFEVKFDDKKIDRSSDILDASKNIQENIHMDVTKTTVNNDEGKFEFNHIPITKSE
jgi:hypothetical protein